MKSPKYQAMEQYLAVRLPPKKKVRIPDGDLQIHYEFGVSRSTDADNCVKGVQDCISRKYNFNDNRVRFHTVLKRVVKPGKEYIKFRIREYSEEAWRYLTQ